MPETPQERVRGQTSAAPPFFPPLSEVTPSVFSNTNNVELPPPEGSVENKAFFSSHNTTRGTIEGGIARSELHTWQDKGGFFSPEQHAAAVARLYERDRQSGRIKRHVYSQCLYQELAQLPGTPL